jgi:AMIN domain
MKSSLSLYGIALFACLILTANYCPTWAAEQANITSVQVAPDLKHISIKCDGPVGRHSTFVIQKPYRLVLDLESTGLGKIPAKIHIGRNPVNEIRLGYANSRARIVVDFGDNPVPSFKVDKQSNSLLVNLGVKAGAWQPKPAPKPAAKLQKDPVQPKVVALTPASKKADSSTVSVKSAGVADDLVFVELVHKKDPKRTYRLVIDLDVEERFDLASSQFDNEISSPSVQPRVGPRRAAGPIAAPSADHPKFKWGDQPGEKSQVQPQDAKLNARGPLRVETFQPRPLQRKVTADEG